MISDEERNRRIRAFLEAEQDPPTRQFWLSFVDPDLPEGKRFLGVAIVEAQGMTWAIKKAHALGVNPGGEAACYTMPPGTVDRKWLDRLLTKEEAESVMPTQTGAEYNETH